MKKDFPQNKLLLMTPEKQIRVLYDLASFIEVNKIEINSTHFEKLKKYHLFLNGTNDEKIQKLNKEFEKISKIDYQFQIYLMNLERLLGQSKKEYDFLVDTGDETKIKRTFPISCLLDSVRSAHNVGAMFRNADCFGSEKVLLCGLSPTPESQQVLKTAMGCEKVVPWTYSKSAVETVKQLKDQGYTIWAVETSSKSINIHKVKKVPTPLVLIFGHELHGISHELLELSDEIISIELFGKKNSLNVSVSQSIVLYQLSTINFTQLKKEFQFFFHTLSLFCLN